MSIIKFFGRKKELAAMGRLKNPYLIFLYGRRRVGKTRLSLHFAKKEDFIYFFVNPKKDNKILLSEFSDELKKKLNLPDYVRIANWKEFLDLLKTYKGIVIFDEFQWFLESDKSFPFELQRFWDTEKDKPSIIITGSVYGLLKKMFVDESSPLYKRCDLQMDLKPLDYKVVFEILDSFGVKELEEKMKFYLTFGGVPYYYSLMHKYGIADYQKSLKLLVFDEFGILKNEVNDILYESLGRDYRVYSTILYAIASGKTQMSEISALLSIKQTSIPAYMSVLEDFLRLTEKQTLLGKKKKSLYLINDYFANFWFRYVYKNKSKIELNPNQALNEVLGDLNIFFGTMFEKFCRENLNKLELPFPVSELSRSLEIVREDGERKQKEIDIVAVNKEKQKILFVECKWKNLNEGAARKILTELEAKSKFVQWNRDKRKEFFGLIAKSIENRHELRKEGFFVFDLTDF